MKRFYKDVSTDCDAEGRWHVLLDGKPIKNSEGHIITAANEMLAKAMVAEWEAVDEKADMTAMPMTRLAGASVNVSDEVRSNIKQDMAAYAHTDLLCYLSEDVELQQWQQERWEPVLQAVEVRYGTRFNRTTSIVPVQQDASAIATIQVEVEALNDDQLIAASQLVSGLGSILLWLAFRDGDIAIERAIELSQLEVAYQTHKWGADEEAVAAQAAKVKEMMALYEFWRLIHQ